MSTTEAIKPLAIFRTLTGETIFHLTRGIREKVGNDTVLDTSAKIKICYVGTAITSNMVLGSGKLQLKGQEIVDAIRDLIARGKPIIEITNGDPLDPRQQEARRRKEQQARLDELEAENARLKLEVRSKQDPGRAKELRDKISALDAKMFVCPFCNKRFETGTVSKRRSGWQSHVATCKKRPATDTEAQEVRDRLQQQQPSTPTAPVSDAASDKGLPPA